MMSDSYWGLLVVDGVVRQTQVDGGEAEQRQGDEDGVHQGRVDLS